MLNEIIAAFYKKPIGNKSFIGSQSFEFAISERRAIGCDKKCHFVHCFANAL